MVTGNVSYSYFQSLSELRKESVKSKQHYHRGLYNLECSCIEQLIQFFKYYLIFLCFKSYILTKIIIINKKKELSRAITIKKVSAHQESTRTTFRLWPGAHWADTATGTRSGLFGLGSDPSGLPRNRPGRSSRTRFERSSPGSSAMSAFVFW